MIWLKIAGYNGDYELSEKGDLRRITKRGESLVTRCKASDGKLYVTLWKNSARKVYMLHRLYADTFKVSIKDAKRILYEGYSGKSEAKENVRTWLLDKIQECEQRKEYNEDLNDEVLYLKMFLKQLSE